MFCRTSVRTSQVRYEMDLGVRVNQLRTFGRTDVAHDGWGIRRRELRYCHLRRPLNLTPRVARESKEIDDARRPYASALTGGRSICHVPSLAFGMRDLQSECCSDHKGRHIALWRGGRTH